MHVKAMNVYCAPRPFDSALAVAVHAPALAVASAAGEALTIPRCAGSPAATEVAARLDTVSNAARVAEVPLHAACATMTRVTGTTRRALACHAVAAGALAGRTATAG